MKTFALSQAALVGFPNSPASVVSQATQSADGSIAIGVRMTVNDQALRDAIAEQGLDGLEAPFAWLPTKSGEYKAFPIAFEGTVSASGTRPTVDHYSAMFSLADGVDPIAAIKQGFSIGLDTNLGRVWLQQPGQNWTVRI